MGRPLFQFGVWFTLCACTGCLNPLTTRLPTWNIGSPEAEKKEYERFDPFPDSAGAPDTYARPRAYVKQREPSRRAIEFNQGKPLPSYPAYPGYAPPPYGPPVYSPPNSGLGSEYPNVVQP